MICLIRYREHGCGFIFNRGCLVIESEPLFLLSEVNSLLKKRIDTKLYLNVTVIKGEASVSSSDRSPFCFIQSMCH